jgi:hypothetical protein
MEDGPKRQQECDGLGNVLAFTFLPLVTRAQAMGSQYVCVD